MRTVCSGFTDGAHGAPYWGFFMGVNDNSSSIRLGISACLLGQNVRYDGGHQHDRFLTDTLGRYVTYVPVCPEVECGLPVPREAMRLVGTADAPRLVTISTKKDLTEQMQSWARRRVQRA